MEVETVEMVEMMETEMMEMMETGMMGMMEMEMMEIQVQMQLERVRNGGGGRDTHMGGRIGEGVRSRRSCTPTSRRDPH